MLKRVNSLKTFSNIGMQMTSLKDLKAVKDRLNNGEKVFYETQVQYVYDKKMNVIGELKLMEVEQ